MLVQDGLGLASLLVGHLAHGFKNGALDVADVAANLVEIQAGSGEGAVEIKDDCCNFHIQRILRKYGAGVKRFGVGVDKHNCLTYKPLWCDFALFLAVDSDATQVDNHCETQKLRRFSNED